MIVLPIGVFVLFAVLGLAMAAAASYDLAHAADPDHDSHIGYDKPRGWVVTLGGLALLVVIAGAAGCGPLAGVVTVGR